MTVKEMRDLLFAIDNEEMTVKEMRAILFAEWNQKLRVTADLFNDELAPPDDYYEWQDDTDDRGWLTYHDRMEAQRVAGA